MAGGGDGTKVTAARESPPCQELIKRDGMKRHQGHRTALTRMSGVKHVPPG